MIPIRIKLEGFLSYRDETILEFDSAPLWMLSGPNGAGKSAIFDAVSYALYGQHRGGKQGVQQLINHQSDKLIVEFDFRVGEDIYRAKRTHAQKGKATREVIHLSGPHTPVARRTGPVVVPGTDEESGFDSWILSNIGLSAKAFMASVMLRQGESDALLRMKPKDRHEVLLELIDLSAYQRLEQRAADKHTKSKGEYDAFDGQLKGAPEVDPKEIESLTLKIADCNTSLSEGNDELSRLARLIGEAYHWKHLSDDRSVVQGQLRSVADLMGHACAIKDQAARLDELNAVLPHLTALEQSHTRLAEADHTIKELKGTLVETNEHLLDERAEHDRLYGELQLLDKEIAETAGRVSAEHKKVSEWRPVADNLAKIIELESKLSGVADKLALYPDDLPEKLIELADKVAHLEQLNALIPWLRQILALRTSWIEAKRKHSAGRLQIELNEASLSELRRQFLAAQTIVEAKKKLWEASRSSVVRSEEKINYLQLRLDNLASIGGKPTCEYCGQPLTPEHLGSEAANLNELLDLAKRAHSGALSAASTDQIEFNGAEAGVSAIQQDGLTLQNALSGARAELEAWAKQGMRSVKDTRQAIKRLPSTYQNRYALSQGTDWEVTWSPYPSEVEIAGIEVELLDRDNLNRELASLRTQNATRSGLLTRQGVYLDEMEQASSAYSDDQRAHAETAYKTALAYATESESALKLAQSSRPKLAKAVENATKLAEGAQGQLTSLNNQLAQQTTLAAELRRGQLERFGQLNETWRIASAGIDKATLQNLEMEQGALVGAAEKLSELDQAQGVQVTLQSRLLELDGQLALISSEAQRDPNEMETLETSLKAELEQLQTGLREMLLRQQRLEDRQSTREKLLSKRHEAGSKSELYRELARLLGRENLQSYLLAEVETSIVDNANGVLDKISGGTLRLELQAAAGAAGAKALDLVAYNSQAGTKPIGVDYLSGSQRFRVAVSLALGIGAYATQAKGQVESVVIDEGFGSLDKQGRYAMIDELHNLKDVLHRIILVSHEDEFAAAFPNRYVIESVDGRSRASLWNSE